MACPEANRKGGGRGRGRYGKGFKDGWGRGWGEGWARVLVNRMLRGGTRTHKPYLLVSHRAGVLLHYWIPSIREPILVRSGQNDSFFSDCSGSVIFLSFIGWMSET